MLWGLLRRAALALRLLRMALLLLSTPSSSFCCCCCCCCCCCWGGALLLVLWVPLLLLLRGRVLGLNQAKLTLLEPAALRVPDGLPRRGPKALACSAAFA
jgi:hypothetical protein